LVPKKRKKGWDSVIQVILNAVVEIDVGPEATDEGPAFEWLRSYLTHNPPLDLDKSPDDSARSGGYPVLKTIDGIRSLVVESRNFRHWLRTAPGFGERIDARKLGIVLRSAEAESKSVRIGEVIRRRWVMPINAEFMPEKAGLGGVAVTSATPKVVDVTLQGGSTCYTNQGPEDDGIVRH